MKILSKKDLIFILSVFCFFVFFSFIYRLILPVGDEPDFFIKFQQLYNNTFFGPILNLLENNYGYTCLKALDIRPGGLWFDIPYEVCLDSLSNISVRILLLIPILILVISFYFFLQGKIKDEVLSSYVLVILMPSVIYGLGLLSFEYLTLIISISLVISGFGIISIILLLFLFLMDLGSFIIAVYFLGVLVSFRFLDKHFGFKSLIVVSLALLSFLVLISYAFLLYIPDFSFFDNKQHAIYVAIDVGGFAEKYNTLTRFTIFYMSLILMLPSYIKFPLLYVVSLFLILVVIKNFKKLSSISRVSFYASFWMPLSIIAIAPTHAYAKYYWFTLPFIILPFVEIFGRLRVLISLLLINLLILIHFIAYGAYL